MIVRLSIGLLLTWLSLLPQVIASTPVTGAQHRSISPYIESHKDDLVQWFPWNHETLQLAARSGRLILLSSGYTACRYCHVMKKESFEDAEVAELINEHFIPVLIDRELMPVLDGQLQSFMDKLDAPQGWPMNVVLTPERHPLVGTVYRPKQDFLFFLKTIQQRWGDDKDRLDRIARSVTDKIVAGASKNSLKISEDAVDHFISALNDQTLLVADISHGGFGQDAKYPMSPQMLALLELQKYSPDKRIAEHLRRTLDRVADGGLRDALDGGFFRYATDRSWKVPHYERMLYDNVQLAAVYLLAAEVFDESRYLTVAESTLEFIASTFLNERQGLIASLSAMDEAGRDGGYYLWSEQELLSYFSAAELKQVTRSWTRVDVDGAHYYLPNASGLSNDARSDMLEQRSSRQQPVDSKTIAAWNGLGLSVFTRAAQQTGNERYRKIAERLHAFILKYLITDDGIQRAAKGGAALLEDYAYVARGMADYAALTGAESHRQHARDIIEQAWERYYIDGYWKRGEDLELLLPFTVYPVTLPDTELPSPSAVLIDATLAMGEHVPPSLRQQSSSALRVADTRMAESPFFYSTQIIQLVKQREAD